MLRNLIVLPDGTELFSGAGTTNAIKCVSLTSRVNDGEELSLGSACASALEATIITPAGAISLGSGEEITLYKVDGEGQRTKKGVFILEKPTRPTANTMKIIGYDRISKLDKDLSEWLNVLTDWPYALSEFARMVCEACGLTLAETDVPNGDFPVYQFANSCVTGRQLMKWIGEICCRFCRANEEGNIEFAWYKSSGVTITPTGNRYFFQGALRYETYQVAAVDAVQLRLADSESGALWPEVEEGANSYIFANNPILLARVTDELLPFLETIESELAGVTYTPCEIAIPACLDINAGSIVDIEDKNGITITSYIMAKSTTGQKDVMECTGSARRDSTTAINNQSAYSVAAQAAQGVYAGLTQEQLFNKLTNNGKIQGIYAQDGKWYINAELAKITNFYADDIVAGKLNAVDGKSYFDLDNGEIVAANLTVNGGTIGGFTLSGSKMYAGDGVNVPVAMIRAPTDNSALVNVIAFGGTSHSSYNDCPFRVTKAGKLYATGAVISGDITAESGTIGDCSIKDGKLEVPAANITGTLTASQIDADGMTAEDVTISGSITATSGEIGGFTLSGSKMYAGDGENVPVAMIRAPTDNSSLVNVLAFGGTSHSSYNDCPFRVTKAGKLYATGAVISGEITATSLSLGSDVTIPTDNVSGLADVATTGKYADLSGKPSIPSSVEDLGLDASTIIYKGDITQSSKTDSNGIGYVETSVPTKTGTLTYCTYDADDYIVFGRSRGTDGAGKNYICVSKDGLLTARNALIYGTVYATDGEFTGKVTADSGAIGGWDLTSVTPKSAGNSEISTLKGSYTAVIPTTTSPSGATLYDSGRTVSQKVYFSPLGIILASQTKLSDSGDVSTVAPRLYLWKDILDGIAYSDATEMYVGIEAAESI